MLDAGCGAGVLVSMAQALGATAIGFDFALCPSEERLDLFRADLNDPASWPEFGDVAEADVVTCIESLYYVPDPLETIWSLWSRVAPGGRMVITTGNSESGIVEQARRKHGGEYRGVHRGGLESLATQLPGCAKYEIIDVWIDAEQRFRPFTTAPRNRPPHRFTLVAQRG